MNETLVLDKPEQINAFRLLALKSMLKLETLGMKRGGKSAFSIVKHEFNLTGNKQKVYAEFCAMLTNKGILVWNN